MRLLKLDGHGGFSFTSDLIEDIPSYAILSHTWGKDDDEVTLNDIKNKSGTSKGGYAKIQFCAEQARKDGLSHIWVDTCCIDKTNNVELSEAIMSMFRWYQDAAKCYAYLADVTACKRNNEGTEIVQSSAFVKSKWFTRGWTLQELLAPKQVVFYSREWKRLGDKHTLEQEIHEATQIPITAIQGSILSDFTPDEKMRWIAKRSTKRPEDKWYCLWGIFDVSMIAVYGEGEKKAFIRLKDEIGKSYLRTLDGIGQIYTRSSEEVQNDSTRPALNTRNGISVQDFRRELLTSMSFHQMDSQRSTIKTAYSTTCAWLLKHAAYLGWVDPDNFHEHHGFLWISGKPGAGKSTLLKFVHANARKDRQEHEIIISFFFNARGDELEKSTTGMYRALLFQLLNEAPDLQEILDDIYRLSEQHVRCPTWTTEMLCELFCAAVARLKQRQLKIFIDALDECDEDQARKMVEFFEELGESALKAGIKLHICFASRPYPAIEIRHGQRLTLEDENGHSQDLARYIRSHLRFGKGKDKDIEKLKTQILEKANGIFMWAVLVIPVLNKEFKDGRKFAVKRRLDEIPTELSNLFKHILNRDKDNMNDFLLCLQWILFARRPLQREEFYFAMVAGIDPEPENMTEWDPEHITEDDMSRFVLSSSKGLAELTKSKTPTVQFIHESVQDFLIKDDGLSELWPELQENLRSPSHDKLKRCCLNYLAVDLSSHASFSEVLPKASSDSAKDLRRELTVNFPFLKYANQYVLHHADEAAKGVLQDDFLVEFPLRRWIFISNMLERYDVRRYTSNASLLYILAEHNSARLITTAYRTGSTLHMRGERHRYPLFAALANGHHEAAQALVSLDGSQMHKGALSNLESSPNISPQRDRMSLRRVLETGPEAPINIPTNLTSLRAVLDARNSRGQNALLWATEMGNIEIVRQILLNTNPQGLEAEDRAGRTALIQATEVEHRDIVALLLENGADVNAGVGRYGTALRAASGSGHQHIMQMLLDAGADINARGEDYGNALAAASDGGYEHIVQMLLNVGADTNAQGEDYGTALRAASGSGHQHIVQMLLDAGADINARGTRHYGTALEAASYRGHQHVVQMLLDAGADINARGEDYGNALAAASDGGYEHIVQMLLNVGADTNAQGEDYGTALRAASGSGHQHIVQMLLDAGADTNAQGGHYGTALAAASYRGNEHIVQMLLNAGADTNAQGGHYGTALAAASYRGNEHIVQMLLDAGADVNAQEVRSGTALEAASYRGHEQVVRMLLGAGANVNAQGGYYTNALVAASGSGNEHIVQMLLDAGADINAEGDGDCCTLLGAALGNGHEHIVQMLLDAGAGRFFWEDT